MNSQLLNLVNEQGIVNMITEYKVSIETVDKYDNVMKQMTNVVRRTERKILNVYNVTIAIYSHNPDIKHPKILKYRKCYYWYWNKRGEIVDSFL